MRLRVCRKLREPEFGSIFYSVGKIMFFASFTDRFERGFCMDVWTSVILEVWRIVLEDGFKEMYVQ